MQSMSMSRVFIANNRFASVIKNHRLTSSATRIPARQTPLTPFLVRAMSSSEVPKLDANTPDEKWREVLTDEEYYVLRMKGTEPPGTGEYNKFYEEGTFVCRGCGAPLYDSSTKFDSGCGWPAFYDTLPDTVTTKEDRSFGQIRTEILCKNCNGHLGHVFYGEGFNTPTDARHCVNSLSIKFVKKSS